MAVATEGQPQPVEQTHPSPWGDPLFVPQVIEDIPSPMFDRVADLGPQFTVSEAAKVFFARSPYWLRWIENQGVLVDAEGEPLVPRSKRTSARVYHLSDIERIAYAMADQGRIDARQLLMCMRVAHAIATVWGLMEPKATESEDQR